MDKKSHHPLDELMENNQWWRGFKYGVALGMCVAFILVGVLG